MDSLYRNLIRKVMRTFYDIPESLVIEYIYHHDRIEQAELAKLLNLDPNKVRAYILKFKRDKIIIEDHSLESNKNNNVGPRTKDLYYYRIDRERFANVVNYRLIQMLHHVENLERQQVYKESKYKCGKCAKEYTEYDVGKLYDMSQDALICSLCREIVQEDNETKETTTEPAQIVNISLYYEQMKPFFEILREINELKKQEQHLTGSTTVNGNSASSTGNHMNTGSIPQSTESRSHASNMYDQTAKINHSIDVFIERDDDDEHYAHMDIDETSNTDSLIGSSRGPGKPGKKPSKPVQSTAEVATQPISAKMKAANKKVPYEPKPLPTWFIESTVYIEQEEKRTNNSTSNTSTTTTMTTSISRQLSNSKLTKSSRLQDIKQLLLAHERKNKSLPLTSHIEDSLSPPTPIPIIRTTDSQ